MLLITGIILLITLLMQFLEVFHFQDYIAVLFPKGLIGLEQRNLLLIIQALMLLVIIPVYVLTFIFSWHYRADNKKATYDPDLVDHKMAEIVWWGLPIVMTAIVAVITWVKTYELDPYKSIASDKKEMKIQVVALQWKWLFIYPEENIATVNFIQIPIDTPVRFEITADAPMNSFWIPQLGGQIYAMPAMVTQLNLIANEPGDFRGVSANISGEGFSGMTFITRASSEEEYKTWIKEAKASTLKLDSAEYEKIVKPSRNSPVEIYQLTDPHLFHQIVMKFMEPQKGA
jgi:cytochrome o ubiquinol oxidase subunit 2